MVGDLEELMMGNALAAKYSDPVNLVVKVQINGISLSNTLIDLGATINFMTKQTMEILGPTNILKTTIVLYLDDQSSVRP